MEPTQVTELSNKLRNEIITYVLNISSLKYAIKQTDLQSIFEENKKMFKSCFEKAQESLKTHYGIVMVEIPDSKTCKKYLAYSEQPACSTLEYNNKQKREITLLFIILSFIFMHDGNVEEERIEEFLKSLNIHYNEEHSYFGDDIKKLITETFVKQYYLTKTKFVSECDSSEVKFFYSWGLRSKVEFPKKRVLEATAKILDMPMQMFHKQLLESENCEEMVVH